ncbi:MAG: phosphatase PAP2 family protein [Pseudomonadales bacterium]|nr:phosphatase PAP2 family protein [Pseudomonadales bacterium]
MLSGALLLGCCLSACESPGTRTVAVQPVPEIRPGILQGYLPMSEPFRSVEFVAASPQEAGAEQQLDDAVSRYSLTLRATPRWEMAKRDADLAFPAAAETFSCALGIPVTEAETPALYMLLRRTLADVGLATFSAKEAYNRSRPFVINGQPTCSPEDEEKLRSNGSYPSGHASLGWGWALILAELAPERAETILARGRAFGESRLVCNVHWYSDIVAGRMVGAGAVASLHANAEFRAAMQAASADIASARKRGLEPGQDCAAQQENLSFGL